MHAFTAPVGASCISHFLMKTLRTAFAILIFGITTLIPALASAADPKLTNTSIYRLSPTFTTTATTDEGDNKNDSATTLSSEAQKLVDKSVAAGRLPTDEELKKFPSNMKQLILAEVARQLQEKNNGENGVLKNVFSEYGMQFLALIISTIGVTLAISGFSLASAKKKKHISKFMNEIDDAFNSFKWKSKRCEAELYRLNDMIEEKLKEGKLDESSYHLLSARIEKYLKEIREVDTVPNNLNNPGGLS